MKKLLVLSLAVVMVAAFTLPASAFESVFGGYWRTRAVHQENFTGNDDVQNAAGQSDTGVTRVDTRTRLYYTAILNDNLKLVNKFEMDAVWGTGGAQYGDFGADGIAVEVKESYVDANIGPVRAKIGVHDRLFARGFIFADEFSGVTLSFKAGDVLIPFSWMKGFEGGTNHNSLDVDVFGIDPFFNFGDNFTLNPFVIYAYSSDGGGVGNNSFSFGQNGNTATLVNDGMGVYWAGANVDATLGSFSLWFTGVYQGGTVDDGTVGADDQDVKAGLLAAGLSVPLGPASLHGQAFYATGDDNAADSDMEAFFGIGGAGVGWAYYWSELMGLGTFDNQVSAGSPGGDVSNMWAANIGATIKPMEKLSLTGDIWYASLVEDNVANNKKLGTEVDLAVDYQLTEGLNLRLVGAYLFADDATQTAAAAAANQDNSDDPYEIGTQLSLSF
jgi:hypothetical protein